MNNKIIIAIVAIILLAGGYYLLFSSSGSNNVQPTEREINEVTKDKIVLDFIEQYESNLISDGELTYTFQLEDELIKKGNPIIFTSGVDDIFREDGEFYIRFAPTMFDFSTPRIFYTLSGCSERITEIVSREATFFDGYVVVARITSIEKPLLSINGYGYGGDEVELEYSPSDTFLATGICLDLVYIEDASLFLKRTP